MYIRNLKPLVENVSLDSQYYDVYMNYDISEVSRIFDRFVHSDKITDTDLQSSSVAHPSSTKCSLWGAASSLGRCPKSIADELLDQNSLLDNGIRGDEFSKFFSGRSTCEG